MPWPAPRDNRILAVLLALLIGLAWYTLWLEQGLHWGHAFLHSAHAAHMGASGWRLAVIFVCSWTVMTIAMMLPTSTRLILLFHRMVRSRPRAAALVALLVAGYILVWVGFGLAAHLLQRALREVPARVPWLVEYPRATTVPVLLGAGIYQFSSLKYACLDKCRSPMSFLVNHWKGLRPSRDAFRLGANHGVYCVGCCWSLMLVMFAVGQESLVWMLALAVVMAAEKNLPVGRRLAAPVGFILIAGAAALLIRRP
jgi:predicted metal-binding membrane protein